MAQEKDSIPYGTYGRVRGVVDQFAESTTPTTLNKHVLRGVSGGDFSALMTALKFLGLITDNQSVKPQFRELVEARKSGEAEYKTAMVKILEAAYQPIIGKIDLAHGTLPELEKAFKDAGVSQGQMVTKAIRFYLKALEDCNVKVSDYITKQRAPRSTKAKNGKAAKKTPKAKKKDAIDDSIVDGKGAALSPDLARLPIPGIDGAFIQYPKNLTDNDCTMFEAMVTVLRTYVKSRKGGEGKKP